MARKALSRLINASLCKISFRGSSLRIAIGIAILALLLIGSANAAYDSEAQSFLSLINSYRAQNNLGPLSVDSLLQDAANWMSDDMLANCVAGRYTCSHTDSTGRAFDQRLRDFGYPAGVTASAGENLAWGYGGGATTAQQVFDLWKNSPGHRANMLGSSYIAIGISRSCSGGDCAWVTDFGSKLIKPYNSDIIPPASITNLKNISYASTYINWTWQNPLDHDFARVMVYIDEKFRINVSKGIRYYKATGLLPNTRHTISTHTVDTSGNINKTWRNHTARTEPDAVAPRSVTDLINRSYAPNYINWTWRDPPDYDFTRVRVYIDGKFRTNISKGIRYYKATGLLPNTRHTISTRTEDTSGNINKTWRNHTASTAPK